KEGFVRSLLLLVEKTVLERYRIEVPDDFDADDPMLVDELFAEGVDKPEPYERRDHIFEVTVEGDLPI
ncbi:hypothetical protein, partial [Mycolicibacterium poriferae]|uniref:hypothetical protein n=1 Tax=Mycolicibacterium poriferae TaxID=39694 RepID=UPI0024BA1806